MIQNTSKPSGTSDLPSRSFPLKTTAGWSEVSRSSSLRGNGVQEFVSISMSFTRETSLEPPLLRKELQCNDDTQRHHRHDDNNIGDRGNCRPPDTERARQELPTCSVAGRGCHRTSRTFLNRIDRVLSPER